MVLEFNLRKCELTILNYTEEEKIQIVGRFQELLPELELVPTAESFLMGALFSEEAIREKHEDFERIV